MNPVTDQQAQLVRAILDDPRNTTLRLAYADFLDEQDVPRVPCWHCDGTGKRWMTPAQYKFVHKGVMSKDRPQIDPEEPCPFCNGEKDTPNPEFALRAEFIRLQVLDPDGVESMARQKDILNFRLPTGVTCRDSWASTHNFGSWGGFSTIDHRMGLLSAWTTHEASFLRSAKRVFAEYPIVSVRLADREPLEVFPGRWCWSRELGEDEPHRIPHMVLDRLKRNAYLVERIDYDSRELALAALSRACIDYGRKQADLPPIDWSK